MGWLAIYAAVVSTMVAVWTVYGIWRDRTSIQIAVRYGYVKNPNGRPYLLQSPEFKVDEITADTRLVLTARNTGRRQVILDDGGIRYKNGNGFAFTGNGWDKTYPIRLAEGESGSTATNLHSLANRTRKGEIKHPMWAYFKSQAGKEYKSRIPKRIIQNLEKARLPEDVG